MKKPKPQPKLVASVKKRPFEIILTLGFFANNRRVLATSEALLEMTKSHPT
jgi:hypothetical protein